MATASAEQPPSRLHETTSHCDAAGYRIYNTVDERRFPDVTYKSGEPQYGVLAADVNADLSLPQARPLSIESFNSGCLNPQGCVSNALDGFACPGPVKRLPAAMSALFAELNSPFAPENFEMQPPPSYVVGVKATGINSVLGWQKGPDGKPLWHHRADASSYYELV